ncbi:MAG: hypothetical protein JJ971_14070 [Balneolaceae bacterium]|nr:hypothetical protein [Balneolaceae bacterium]MBO6547015.1 hypothetical protein [Balneolaceae bacterium]MBO6648038.1 hypothetical protein [Balneolaceae bacterium]
MRAFLGFIGALVLMFSLGGIWNAVLMQDFYLAYSPTNILPPEDFSITSIALGYIVLTAIMTFIVVQNFNENPKFVGGFMFGGTFGLAATLPLYLILYGRWDISLTYILVDSAWHVFEQGLGGALLCWLYYRGTKND